MKIAVVTLAIGEEYKKSISLGLKSKETYCEVHGYENIVGGMSSGRPASWEKIPLVLAVLHKFDWVFFADGDTMVMNQSIKLENLIAKYDKYDIALTRGGRYFCNAGCFFVRNCKWSRSFLEEAYNAPNGCREVITGRFWEQGMFNAMLTYNSLNCWDRIVIEHDRKIFNCPTGLFEDGDFLVHFITKEEKSCSEVQEKMDQYFSRILWYSTTSNPS